MVCLTDYVPDNVIEYKNGWSAFRIQGTPDFSLIGILSKISTLLAANKIGIFAISTIIRIIFLPKKESFDKAIKVLSNSGYGALIKDVLVFPEYQRNGIGSEMMRQIIEYLKERMKPCWSVCIDLMTAPGKETFYQKFGFVACPRDNRGAGMDLWLEKLL